MIEFWNQRYAEKEYAYGESPNRFFASEIQKLTPGMVLCPAEGEGRNAVYAASKGWKVKAFDSSIEGKNKAEILAKKKGVSIDYELSDFQNYAPNVFFDCIALLFAHSSPDQRQKHHLLVSKWLKPGGKIILQGFSKNQLGKSSGGPQNLEMLFNKENLLEDFNALKIEMIEEIEIILDEGKYHKGPASVINLIATKPIEK